jgi:ribosomal protein S18 acetylase RimI-like enzyme
MSGDFAGAPEEPRSPDGVKIRRCRADEEERAVHAVVMEAFSEGWDFTPQPFEEFLHWATAMNSDRTLWWVAEDNGELAGTCICRPSAQGDDSRGWVETLAVRKPWRGQGLGRALLLTAFGEFHRRGQTGAALSVDTENVTGAVRLYESVGMHATRRLGIYERPLDD